MNLIQLLVFFEIFYLYIFFVYIIAMILYIIYTNCFGFTHNIFSPKDGAIIKNVFKNAVEKFLQYLLCPAIGILVIFIILYILYLIIIYCIPEYILFIPIRKILLDIYPFPDLIKYSIFSLFDGIVNTFISSGTLLDRLGISGTAIGSFIENNSKIFIEEKFPKLKNKKLFKNKKNKKDHFDNEDELTDEEKEVIDNNNNSDYVKNAKAIIMAEKESCINKNIKLITPDMSEIDKSQVYLDNFNVNVKCTSKSLESFFRINNK